MNKMRHLILYVNKNSEGKHDGEEFEREAIAYAKYHNTWGHETIMIPVPCHVPALRRPAVIENNIKQIFDHNDRELFDVFAYFGHGTERWIQTGHTLAKLDNLVSLLGQILTPCATLWFAACKTGANNPRAPKDRPEGILQALCLRLAALPTIPTAWGHTTAGHTTKNPNLALCVIHERFEVTKEQRKILQKALWAPESNLRFQIPLCSTIDSLLERIES